MTAPFDRINTLLLHITTEDFQENQFIAGGVHLEECKNKTNAKNKVNMKVNTTELSQFQYRDNEEFRHSVSTFFEQDKFLQAEINPHNPNLADDLQKATLEKLLEISKQRFLSVWDIERDPKKYYAFAESFTSTDIGLGIKYMLTYHTLGHAITSQGTEEHLKYLEKIDSGEILGCFSLAEIGHGNNYKNIETTATYDKHTQQFIIHSPTHSSIKSWVGNGKHATHAILFCQLYIGKQCFGVHQFVVQLRDHISGSLLPGIIVCDMSEKEGLKSLDHSTFQFINHRVNRNALLDRYTCVTHDGEYHHSVDNDKLSLDGSFMVLTLVTRMLDGIFSLNAMKIGLSIASRFSFKRRQFGVYGDIEYPVIDYTYLRIVPFVASSFAITSFCNYIKEMQAEKKFPLEKMFILTISLKVAASWEALKALQMCRECCGAEGYLEKNVIPSLKGDVDGMITMDGDNTALLQLIGRYLIHKLHERFKKRGAQMAYMKERVKYMLFENQFLRARADPSVMLTPEFQLRAFKMREERLLISLAGRFNNKLHKSVNSFDAWNKVRDHVSSLTNAYMQRMILKSFSNDIANSTSSDSTKFYLNQMRSLYALNIIANDPWFYTTGNFTLSHLKIIRFQIYKITKKLKSNLIEIVDSYFVSKKLIERTIAKTD